MSYGLHGADTAVEVGGNGNIFAAACFGEIAEKIVIKGRVAGADFCIVIRQPLIAAGMKAEIIYSAAFELIGKIFRIKILADIGIIDMGMIIEKETVSYFFMQYISVLQVNFPDYRIYETGSAVPSAAVGKQNTAVGCEMNGGVAVAAFNIIFDDGVIVPFNAV